MRRRLSGYFAFGPVVDVAAGPVVDVSVDEVDVVFPRGLAVVADAPPWGVVVAAFDGCVVDGLSVESSSLHAVTAAKSMAVATSAASTRAARQQNEARQPHAQ